MRRRIIKTLITLGLLWLWQALALGVYVTAYGLVDRAQPADVIVVLGAGLRPDSTPGPALIRRARQGANLWKRKLAPMIVCSGGRPGRAKRSEAEVCAELIRQEGVPAHVIIQEERSRSTEENAIETRKLMDAHGWQTAIITSDGYHLFRARWIFRSQGVNTYLSPAAANPPPVEALVYISREVLALHWQIFKEALNLPITYVQSI
jgi:uncharacterized SAM-binding protein YcdF (DUF218 family)